jgi:GT2 family glycosyltransferase
VGVESNCDIPSELQFVTKLTVVIPVARSADTLRECLEGLDRASGGQVEVIVVFDGSPTDDLLGLAVSHGVRHLQLAHPAGQAAALNHGIAAATTSWVILLDADIVICRDALTKLLHMIDHANCDAVVGTYTTEIPTTNMISALRNLWHIFVFGHNSRFIATFWTGCSAVRRSSWVAANKFDETPSLAGNFDAAFGAALSEVGCKIWFAPDFAGTHLKKWTIRKWLRSDWSERACPFARLVIQGRARESVVFSSPSRAIAAVAAAAIVPCSLLSIVVPPLFFATLCLFLLPPIAHYRFVRLASHEGGVLLGALALPFIAVRYLLLGFAIWWVLLGPGGHGEHRDIRRD